jgi:hypothetical protein
LLGKPNGFAAVAGFSDNLNRGVGLEQELKALADYAMIIGNKYFGGGRHETGFCGSYRQTGGISSGAVLRRKSFLFSAG